MYRAEPSQNHLCTRAVRERSYKKHRDALATIKPSIDNSAPKSFPHLKSNLKKKQLEKERGDQIGKDNRILVDKMTEIMGKHYIDNKNNNIKFVGSLNSDKRRRDLKKITEENSAILKRIQTKQPVYNHLKWEQEWSKTRKWMNDKTTVLQPINQGTYYPINSVRRSKSFQEDNLSDEEPETVEVYEGDIQEEEDFNINEEFVDQPTSSLEKEAEKNESEQEPSLSKFDYGDESKVDLNDTYEETQQETTTSITTTATTENKAPILNLIGVWKESGGNVWNCTQEGNAFKWIQEGTGRVASGVVSELSDGEISVVITFDDSVEWKLTVSQDRNVLTGPSDVFTCVNDISGKYKDKSGKIWIVSNTTSSTFEMVNEQDGIKADGTYSKDSTGNYSISLTLHYPSGDSDFSSVVSNLCSIPLRDDDVLIKE